MTATTSHELECPPVLLLLFNRPANAKRLLEHVRQGKPKRLYLSVDGPRPEKDGEAELVLAVQQVAQDVDWDCEVHTRFLTENVGCKHGPAGGISWFFEHEEMGIILEDDCLPDPTFFPFCGELLDRYRADERVMMISGDDFARSRTFAATESYYFHKYQLIWGWATWKRAWSRMDLEMATWKLRNKWTFLRRHCKSVDERLFWLENFNKVADPRENSIWDYQWLYTLWLHDGLCISPVGNLVSNVGFGEDATHTTGRNDNHGLAMEPVEFPLRHPEFAVDLRLQEEIRRRFYMPRRRGLLFIASWLRNGLKRKWSGGNP